MTEGWGYGGNSSESAGKRQKNGTSRRNSQHATARPIGSFISLVIATMKTSRLWQRNFTARLSQGYGTSQTLEQFGVYDYERKEGQYPGGIRPRC